METIALDTPIATSPASDVFSKFVLSKNSYWKELEIFYAGWAERNLSGYRGDDAKSIAASTNGLG